MCYVHWTCVASCQYCIFNMFLDVEIVFSIFMIPPGGEIVLLLYAGCTLFQLSPWPCKINDLLIKGQPPPPNLFLWWQQSLQYISLESPIQRWHELWVLRILMGLYSACSFCLKSYAWDQGTPCYLWHHGFDFHDSEQFFINFLLFCLTESRLPAQSLQSSSNILDKPGNK